MTRPLDVTLCGYYGFGNLGDELLARSLVDLLEEAGVPRFRVGILSANPEDARRTLGVVAANRWSPLEAAWILGRSRTLLLGGGGLLQDATSLRSCLYYWGVVRLARLRGSVPWAFGQSVGPLRSPLGRRLALEALRACPVRVVRDRPSLELVRSLGLGAVELAPDPVLGLSLPPRESGGSAGRWGINLRPWRGGPLAEAAREIRDRAAAAGKSLVGVALAEEDRRCLEEARDREGVPLEEIRLLDSPEAFADLASRVDGLAAMRLHALVLAVLAGLPAAAVPYDPKVSAFALTWKIPTWTRERGWSVPDPLDGEGAPEGERLAVRERLREALARSLDRLSLKRGGGGS